MNTTVNTYTSVKKITAKDTLLLIPIKIVLLLADTFTPQLFSLPEAVLS